MNSRKIFQVLLKNHIHRVLKGNISTHTHIQTVLEYHNEKSCFCWCRERLLESYFYCIILLQNIDSMHISV